MKAREQGDRPTSEISDLVRGLGTGVGCEQGQQGRPAEGAEGQPG